MSFPLPHNMNPEDIRYMHVDAVIQGKDRNRIKYLDLEGRWVLSGRSIPYISSVFNHIEHLNYARGPLFDITEPALNAIGLVGWTSEKKPEPKKEKKPFVVDRPRVEVQEEVPEPREVLPHRTAGYGPEHHVKRKISLSRERSRSPSVSPSRGESPLPPYDKYATRYKRKASCLSDDDFDLPLPPPPTFEDLEFKHKQVKAKEVSTKEVSSFEMLISELNEFDRRKLRPVGEKQKQKDQLTENSLHERLKHELLKFDHSKLRHINIIERQVPNVMLNKLTKKSRLEEDLVFQLVAKAKRSTKRDDKGCQTELINELKNRLANRKPSVSISSNISRKSSINDSGLASPTTYQSDGVSDPETPSPKFQDKNKWQLVEERVCRIRIIETEYF